MGLSFKAMPHILSRVPPVQIRFPFLIWKVPFEACKPPLSLLPVPPFPLPPAPPFLPSLFLLSLLLFALYVLSTFSCYIEAALEFSGRVVSPVSKGQGQCHGDSLAAPNLFKVLEGTDGPPVCPPLPPLSAD